MSQHANSQQRESMKSSNKKKKSWAVLFHDCVKTQLYTCIFEMWQWFHALLLPLGELRAFLKNSLPEIQCICADYYICTLYFQAARLWWCSKKTFKIL